MASTLGSDEIILLRIETTRPIFEQTHRIGNQKALSLLQIGLRLLKREIEPFCLFL